MVQSQETISFLIFLLNVNITNYVQIFNLQEIKKVLLFLTFFFYLILYKVTILIFDLIIIKNITLWLLINTFYYYIASHKHLIIIYFFKTWSFDFSSLLCYNLKNNLKNNQVWLKKLGNAIFSQLANGILIYLII